MAASLLSVPLPQSQCFCPNPNRLATGSPATSAIPWKWQPVTLNAKPIPRYLQGGRLFWQVSMATVPSLPAPTCGSPLTSH